MSSEYVGKIVRFLMENHKRNKAIYTVEIKDLLSISSTDIPNLLSMAQELLSKFSLEIVGLNGNEVVSINEGKKLFLRRLNIEGSKKSKPTITLMDKRFYTVFSLIQIENNNLDESRIKDIENSKYFAGIKVLEFMEKMKHIGYLSSRKEDETIYWFLGWRYYVEYGDSFELLDGFENEIQETLK